jgi:NADH-quinone oxidoreductase subunit N
MIVLLTSVYFADLDHSYQISESSFTYSFYSWLFQFVLLVSVTGFICISKEFAASKKLLSFEFDLIICFSLLGLVLINICDDFLTLYIAIELQSLCFYVLATFARNSEFSTEAGIKYFVLGALSSGLLLFGFSLFYAGFGCLSFESIEKANVSISCLMAVAGSFFFSVAILFKLGAFPFHMWLCDVYDGSILNVTAFFSVVPKAIMLGFFVKFVFVVISMNTAITDYLLVLAGLGSICFASVAALYQKRLKRLMAYSTVSHTGFLLIGMFCCSVDSIKACTIYIVLYILMTLSVFGVLFLGGIRNDQQRYLIN